tara:strand:+ start:342 stop:2297 length:1956 start_codon:yes stop_codon:yes gene_type:complete
MSESEGITPAPESGPLPEEFEDAQIPEVVGRDAAESLLPRDVESHALVAVVILVLAVCIDAITALDTPNNAEEAASSLRVSSIVAILAAAAPAIRHQSSTENQRLLIGLLLAFLALAGRHTGTLNTRVGDLVFSMLVLSASAKIYAQGGIEADDVRPDLQDAQCSPHRRQSIGALFGALLLYVGLRGVRAAFVSSFEAADFKVYYTVDSSTQSSPGYAFASADVAGPLGGGYGILAATGATVLLHNDARVVGSGAVAFEVAVGGVGAAVAALWAMLGHSHQIDTLTEVFGPRSCSSSRDACGAAFDARRFSVVNNCASGLWIGALACCVFSFATERRIFDSEPADTKSLWKRGGFALSTAMAVAAAAGVLAYSGSDWYADVCACLVVLGVYLSSTSNTIVGTVIYAGAAMAAAAAAGALAYGSTSGSDWHTDVCAYLAVLGVYLSFTSNTIVGTVIYAGAQMYEESMLLQNYGAESVFVHLTHCTLFMIIVLLCLHALGSIVSEVTFILFAKERQLETFLAIVATLGTSLSTGLYTASALLLACSNGALPEDKDTIRDGNGKRTMIAFLLNHFVVIFIWLPLYACRCEVQRLSQYTRAVVWLLSVPTQAIFYSVALGFLQRSAPSLSIVDPWPFGLASVLGVGAWAAGAFV